MLTPNVILSITKDLITSTLCIQILRRYTPQNDKEGAVAQNDISYQTIPRLPEERIVLLFVSDGGGRSVSRIDSGLLGQGEEMVADALAEVIEVATLQVGAADASVEQHIAGEHAGSRLAIIHHTARRVSRHMIGFQL